MKRAKSGHWVLAMVVVLAVFVRFYGVEFGSGLSPEQKASVALSISAGILSVVGLYFLVKELFDEKLAAVSSFLLAVSSWHILVSQSGAENVFASFVLILAFYFIWHGLKYGHVFDFFLAGLFGGAGFYANRDYFVAPLIILTVFWNYWDYLKKDFSFSKYEQAKTQILGGFSLLVITTLAVALPIGFYVWQNPGFILSADNSVFSNTKPLVGLWHNLGWIVDKIVLIKFGDIGTNIVSWPISILFAIGFIKELAHWLKRKHGHFSVVHTFIFSWLFVMLIPALLSSSKPSVLSLYAILPVVMIIAAKGLWWIVEKLNEWDHLVYPRQHKHWTDINAGPFLAMLALLVSIALLELF